MKNKTDIRDKVLVASRKVTLLGVATLFTFSFSLFTVTAQENINAGGGNASGSGGTVSYSVGQVMYNTHTGTNGSVAEGVQQPYEISVVTGIEEAKDINLLLTAFPNPTEDYLTLEIKSIVQTQDFASQEAQKQYFASLYDLNGKLLQKIPITNQQTRIDMNNLAPATYFLKVTVQTQYFASQEVKTQDFASQEIKTFKIIKN
ncbi:MAG: T9SS type A sorting domain-containing protein [Bacteroidales bacterium]|nr:T9SS type A sorting domain-containing protein [Bacteroidales bacterium]